MEPVGFTFTGVGGSVKRRVFSHSLRYDLVGDSPLRKVDPRVKLFIALVASLAVMLPLNRLVIFWGGYLIFLTIQKLLPESARFMWRLRWLLVVLFALDWFLIGLELAVVVTLRLALMSGVFILVVATTTPAEIGLALESLRLPYRFAFSLGLAFQSLSLLDDEWRAIQEAQRSRGFSMKLAWNRQLLRSAGDLVALTVPAIVLTTKRAWSITEAAYARGFDAPYRQPYRKLHMRFGDWLYCGFSILFVIFIFWR
jgi:energy-coupling factor transporter transmembrane protein EcfT